MGDTMRTMNEISLTYLSIGEYEKVLGENHPETIKNINILGDIYTKKGDYDEALDCFELALLKELVTMGKDHFQTVDTIRSIRAVYVKKGEYGKALKWSMRVLKGNYDLIQ